MISYGTKEWIMSTIKILDFGKQKKGSFMKGHGHFQMLVGIEAFQPLMNLIKIMLNLEIC